MTANATACRCGESAAAVVAEEDILGLLQQHDGSRGGLVALLQTVQARYGYLPEAALRAVSRRTGCSLVDLYGVATFYRSFSLKPRGEHVVCACLGTACHVRGGAKIAEKLQEQLGVEPGETTPDGQFTLETAACLGACAVGPVVVIDERYFSKVRPSRVGPLLEEARNGFDQRQLGAGTEAFPIDVSCLRCNHSLMDGGVQLDSRPTIRVMTVAGDQQGWLWLSSLYGSAKRIGEQELAPDAVLSVFCPHCQAELLGASNCSLCRAPLVPVLVRAGGIAQFCSRRGCPGWQLDLDGIAADAWRKRGEG